MSRTRCILDSSSMEGFMYDNTHGGDSGSHVPHGASATRTPPSGAVAVKTVVVRCATCSTLNRVDLARLDSRPKCSRCQNALPFDRPLIATDADFLRFIEGASVPVLVDFYADWCGPCKMMAPVLEAFAKHHAGELLVLKVDTDANQAVSRKFRIASIPTLLVFREGREWKRQVGAVSKGALEAMLIE
jgi:thioredoxin 2